MRACGIGTVTCLRTSALLRLALDDVPDPRRRGILAVDCVHVDTVLTLRRELFDRLLIVNEHHPRRVLTEYLLQHRGLSETLLGELSRISI